MKLTETKMAQITSDILFANREQLTAMVQAIQHRRNRASRRNAAFAAVDPARLLDNTSHKCMKTPF